MKRQVLLMSSFETIGFRSFLNINGGRLIRNVFILFLEMIEVVYFSSVRRNDLYPVASTRPIFQDETLSAFQTRRGPSLISTGGEYDAIEPPLFAS